MLSIRRVEGTECGGFGGVELWGFDGRGCRETQMARQQLMLVRVRRRRSASTERVRMTNSRFGERLAASGDSRVAVRTRARAESSRSLSVSRAMLHGLPLMPSSLLAENGARIVAASGTRQEPSAHRRADRATSPSALRNWWSSKPLECPKLPEAAAWRGGSIHGDNERASWPHCEH